MRRNELNLDIVEVLLANRWIDESKTYNGTPCWRWFGAMVGRYGTTTIGGVQYYVHRVVAHLYHGLDLDNPKIQACHHCDQQDCFNPAHLFVGTRFDNMKDCSTKGRHRNQKKTHCPKGHPLDGKNNRGQRVCETCHRARSMRYYNSKKAKSEEVTIQ